MTLTYSYSVIDSYTGLPWCGAGLHLLDERNADTRGRCRPCQTRKRRQARIRAEKLCTK